MMRRFLTPLVSAALVAAIVGASQSALADATVTDFDNYNPNQEYAGWSHGLNVSGPTAYTAVGNSFGGAYKDLIPNPDGTGATHIELDVTVVGDFPNVLTNLGDTDGSEYGYRWFTLAPGNHVVTLPLSPVPSTVPGVGDSILFNAGGVAGLNVSAIDFLHIQVDSHGSTVPYTVTFNNLRLVTIPEPATLAMAASGILGLAAVVRRRAT